MRQILAPVWTAFLIVVVASSAALAQAKPACDAKGRVMTPEKVEGVVVYIDQAQSRLHVREADNTVHEFQASEETLEDLKVGDRIEANLKEAPKCQ